MAIKMINMGISGSGKTQALASLCAAGYKVCVADLDNGIEALKSALLGGAYPKEAIHNLRWKVITEPMRMIGGNIQPKAATVWTRTTDLMGNWKGDLCCGEDGVVRPAETGLGDPYTWDQSYVIAVDTLSTLGTAAANFNLQMNGNLGKTRTSNEGRRDIGAAQAQLDKFLQFCFDDSLKCNVILNTHMVNALEDGSQIPDNFEGTKFLFPAAIGKALSTQMGKYFNHLLLTKREGVQHAIYTRGVIGAMLKSGNPAKVSARYDAKDGLAKYFEAIQGPLPKAQV